jgi:hypothetical protein
MNFCFFIKMGPVLSLATTVIETVKVFRDNSRQDAKDEERRRVDSIKEPIPPPRFYTSIAERDRIITDKSDPFSSESIRIALASDIIPTSYSLEQLEQVGFSTEVSEYKKRRSARVGQQRDRLKSSLQEILKVLTSSFPDLSEDDRKAFESAGLFNDTDKTNLIEKIKVWVEAVDKNQLDLDSLNDILKIASSRVDVVEDALGSYQLKQDIQSKIAAAENKRDSTILEFINRSLSYK